MNFNLLGFLCLLAVARAEERTCTTPECVQAAGKALSTRGTEEPAGSPCEDMYSYSCANFIRPERLPPGTQIQSGLLDANSNMMKKLAYLLGKEDDLSNVNINSSAEAKARLFYKSCMEAVHDPSLLTTVLDEIGSWPLDEDWNYENHSLEGAIATIMSFSAIGEVNGLMKPMIGPGIWNNTERKLYITQPKLVFQSPSHYGKDSPSGLDYILTFSSIALLTGATNQEEIFTYGRRIWELESEIAKIIEPDLFSKPLGEEFIQLKIGSLANNKTKDRCNDKFLDVACLDYKQLFSNYLGKDLSDDDEILVAPPNYLNDLADVLAKFGRDEIAVYSAWRCLFGIYGEMPELPEEVIARVPKLRKSRIFEKRQPMRKHLLMPIANSYETTQPKQSYERCTQMTNEVLPFATASMYSKYYGSHQDKKIAEEMLLYMIDYFPSYIDKLKWLDDITRERAKEKAANIRLFVAYPDWILDDGQLNKFYSNLHVTADHANNLYNMATWNHWKSIQLYRQRPTRNIWEEMDTFPPLTVNAMCSLETNSVVVFLGILDQPLYYRQPRSFLFGTLGYIIGHEIFHGFDVSGRWHDAEGNIADWWEERAAADFEERAECFRKQYDALLVDGFPTDGKKVLGESTSDNGGLSLAFGAYQRWRRSQTDETLQELDPLLPGLNMTHEQQFFLSFSQTWCQQTDREMLEIYMEMDEHPQSIARINGVLVNSPSFAEAFNCSVHTPMNPKKKCKLW